MPSGWIVGATGVERDRRDEAGRHHHPPLLRRTTSTISPGRPARIISSGTRSSSIRGAAAGRHPAAAAARACRPGRPAFRGDARDAQVLRRVVRAVSVRPPHDRRSGVAERRGRDGIPDADHRRHPLARARATPTVPEGVIDPRSRAPVLVRHRRHQRVRARVDGRRVQHLLHRARHRAGVRRTYYTKRYFGDFIPWVFRDFPLQPRRSTAIASPAYRRRAQRRRAVDADVARTGPEPAGAITYNKTALWLHTLERMVGWDDAAADPVDLLFAMGSSGIRSREDFFAVANEVSGRDLTWFFDQVYRELGRVRLRVDVLHERAERRARLFRRRREPARSPRPSANAADSTRTVVVRRFGDGIFPVDVRVVLREQGGDPLALGRTRSLEDASRSRSPSARVVRPGRSGSRAAARRELHEQFGDAGARRPPRAARKWSLAWLVWLQDHLLTYGFFV